MLPIPNTHPTNLKQKKEKKATLFRLALLQYQKQPETHISAS